MNPCLKLIAVGTLALAAHASAATIVRHDSVGTLYNGAGVLDTTTGVNWSSALTFDLGGNMVTLAKTGSTGTNSAATIGLFDDYNHSGSTVSFSGLDSTKLYTIVLYSADASAQGATWTLNTGSYTGPLSRVSTGLQTTTFVEGENYVRFDNVSSSAGGVITFGMANDGAGASILNGLEIAVVPEPSAALLGGLGVLALLRRRRH